MSIVLSDVLSFLQRFVSDVDAERLSDIIREEFTENSITAGLSKLVKDAKIKGSHTPSRDHVAVQLIKSMSIAQKSNVALPTYATANYERAARLHGKVVQAPQQDNTELLQRILAEIESMKAEVIAIQAVPVMIDATQKRIAERSMGQPVKEQNDWPSFAQVASQGAISDVSGGEMYGPIPTPYVPREIANSAAVDAQEHWQVVRAKVRRGRQQMAMGRKPTVQVGTLQLADGPGFTSGAPKRIQLFITRVPLNVSSQIIKDFCEKKGAAILDIEKVSRPGSPIDSYHIMFPYACLEKVYQPDFWPAGIIFWRWRVKKVITFDPQSNQLADNAPFAPEVEVRNTDIQVVCDSPPRGSHQSDNNGSDE